MGYARCPAARSSAGPVALYVRSPSRGGAVAWVAREPRSSRDSHETGTRHETLSESVSRHTTPVTESCGVAFRHDSRERHGTSVGGWSRWERKYYSAKYYSPRSWHRGSGGYDGGRRTKAIEWL